MLNIIRFTFITISIAWPIIGIICWNKPGCLLEDPCWVPRDWLTLPPLPDGARYRFVGGVGFFVGAVYRLLVVVLRVVGASYKLLGFFVGGALYRLVGVDGTEALVVGGLRVVVVLLVVDGTS